MAKKPILKKLKVHALRGAMKPVEIEFHKPLTLIYGENGTGKSTLCDALDLLGNKKVGSVEGRGLGTTHGYWRSVGKVNTDISVELETNSSIWKATVSGKNVNIYPQGAVVPLVSVLRRAQILDLIQAKPADRFAVIKPFIDIAEIEKSEAELRSLIRNMEEGESQASIRIDENRASIENYWQRLGDGQGNVIEWAKKEAQIDLNDVDNEDTLFKELVKTLNTLKIDQQNYQQANQKLISAHSELEIKQQAIDVITQAALPGTQEVLGILQAASRHFNSHPKTEKCPLCESTEFAHDLPQKVAEKIAQLNTLNQAITNKNTAVTNLNTHIGNTELEGNKLTQSITDISQKIEECIVFQSLQKNEVKDTISTLQQQLALNIDSIESKTLNESIEKLIDDINKRCEQIAKYKGEITGLKSALQQYNSNVENQKASSALLPVLKRTLQIHESERKQFIDDILSQIANEVGRLYELLHPGEGLNQIELMLDPVKRASLEIGADFYGLKNAPPAAYFSDSHLDTLGLCVFIAIANLNDLENTILILDDVLGSIDEPHVDRLVETLYDETKRFMHCIITTHYRPWREKFRMGQLRNGQCQLIELGKWSHHNGLTVGAKGTPPVDELRNLIEANPQSQQLICASAGVLLEQVCDFLTEKYECSMPRKKYGHTLGDLLPAINGKLRAALRTEIKQNDGSYLNLSLKDKFEELQNIASTRNIFGCHYNELANFLPVQDAQRFGQLVLELAESIICPDEGLPSSDKSGSYWSTKNETRRLHPLRKPS